MDKGDLELVLGEFPEAFDCVKPLCGALFTGTPRDPNILYSPIVIRAFDDATVDVELGLAKG
ncbi:hypothetical protein ACQKWADRAFT_281437 [Trichoderma austrokoningii]